MGLQGPRALPRALQGPPSPPVAVGGAEDLQPVARQIQTRMGRGDGGVGGGPKPCSLSKERSCP